MFQSFSGQPVQFLALDAWNGTLAQASSFVSNTGISYPLLRNASGVSNQYAGGYEYVYVVDGFGKVSYRNLGGWNTSQVQAAVQTALDELNATPAPLPRAASLQLGAPVPSPFNPRTSLEIRTGESFAGDFRLDVFDLKGRRIRQLLSGRAQPGQVLPVTWNGLDDDGRPAPSGVFFFRLVSDSEVITRKGVLVR